MTQPPRTAAEKERFYDTLAPEWESKMNRYEQNERLRLVIERMLPEGDIRGKHFLDGGCGIGLLSERAKAMGADVTAIDIGEKLIEMTVKRCLPASLLELPFKDGEFAVVCPRMLSSTPRCRARPCPSYAGWWRRVARW